MSDQIRSDQNLVFLFDVIQGGQRYDINIANDIQIDGITAIGSTLSSITNFDKTKLVISKQPSNGLGEYTAIYDVNDFARDLNGSDRLRVALTFTVNGTPVEFMREFNVYEIHPTMTALTSRIEPGDTIPDPLFLQIDFNSLQLNNVSLRAPTGFIPNVIVGVIGDTVAAIDRTLITVTKIGDTLWRMDFTDPLLSTLGDPIDLPDKGALQVQVRFTSDERDFDLVAQVPIEAGVDSTIANAIAAAIMENPAIKLKTDRANNSLQADTDYGMQQTANQGTAAPTVRFNIPE